MNLPRKSLAAVLFKQKQPLEIIEIDLPESLDVGQVLVKLSYSGICGSQLGEIDGAKGNDPWLPHLLGHEGSGKVLAAGPGVKNVCPGDSVVLHWKTSRGLESATPKYKWNGHIINAGWVTTFNEYAVISENRLTKINDDAELKTAALYGCAITTGFGVIDNVAKIKIGETVIVFGAGGIGLNIIQAAKYSGAGKIVAVDLYDHRLALAKYCGADFLINAKTQNPWEIIDKKIANLLIDVFIDNTGNPEVISKGYDLVGNKGRVILVGVPKKHELVTLYTLPLHFGKSIIGTHGGEAVPQSDIPRYMNFFASRNIDLNNLISEIKGLKEINQMITHMRDGSSAGRCLIKF